jgi:hypothetical protein
MIDSDDKRSLYSEAERTERVAHYQTRKTKWRMKKMDKLKMVKKKDWLRK